MTQDTDRIQEIAQKGMRAFGDNALGDVAVEDLTVEEIAAILHVNFNAWKELQAYYRCAMMEIETKFNVLNEQFSVQHDRNPIEVIKTRTKTPESLAEKMVRRGLSFSLESIENEIFDVAGVRVICSFPEDIYMLADCLIAQDDVTLIKKKDYIENPKPNGYRSLHLIVEVPIFLKGGPRPMKVEVQLRTIAMDFWASLEHKLKYKKNLDPMLAIQLESELLECSHAAAELDMRMQGIRNRILTSHED